MQSTSYTEDDYPPLPKDKIPECWNDDMRMNSLFAPFRQRNVNPLDWDAKLKFWKTLIGDWCNHKNSPSFTIDELKRAFQRDGRSPLCFPTVVETMYRNNELALYKDYIDKPFQQTWSAWTVDVLLRKPLVWTYKKMKDSVVTPPTDAIKDETYVHITAAKTQGGALYSAIVNHHKGHLLDLEEIQLLCENKKINIKDFNLAIHSLHCEGKVAINSASQGHLLVKFAVSPNTSPVITELDLGVYALKRNEKALTKHVEQLEKEKQAVVQEARAYLNKGMRQVAKSCLRKKHELEKCIDKRASALENVQLLLSRIQEAESDSQVMEAYKMGVAALKTTFKEAGLTEDSVAHTVDDVEEVLDIHQEIQNTLSQPIGVSADEDLEGELAALLMSDTPASPPPGAPPPKTVHKKEEVDLESRLLALRTNLPEPPTTKPGFSKPKGAIKDPTTL